MLVTLYPYKCLSSSGSHFSQAACPTIPPPDEPCIPTPSSSLCLSWFRIPLFSLPQGLYTTIMIVLKCALPKILLVLKAESLTFPPELLLLHWLEEIVLPSLSPHGQNVFAYLCVLTL